jgi:amino acid permease
LITAAPVAQTAAGGDTTSWYTSRRVLIILGGLAVMLPLCMLRTLYALRHVSVLSLAACIYLVVMVCYKQSTHPHGAPVAVDFELNSGPFESLPLICFALQNLIPAPQLFHELPRRLQTTRNMDFIALCAYLLCLTLYLAGGYCVRVCVCVWGAGGCVCRTPVFPHTRPAPCLSPSVVKGSVVHAAALV